MRGAYYNEIDPYAAQWLRNLIAARLIPAGDVDERDIRAVGSDDLRGYVQCHFFAGIGGWAYAGRLAKWPDDKPIWTGSCPCQPFSAAGKRKGTDDARHLWPDFFRLIRAERPVVVMGEQVAGSLGYGWFDGVRSDLASEGYAGRGVDVPACAVDAPHIRNRLYWIAERGVADSDGCERDGRPVEPERGQEGRTASGWPDAQRTAVEHSALIGRGQRSSEAGMVWRGDAAAGANVCELDMDHAGIASSGRHAGTLLGAQGGSDSEGREARSFSDRPESANRRNGTFWSDAEWIICHDGKARRAKSGIPLLANGLRSRISKWRAIGNAIVPQLAAEVIGAYMDCTNTQPSNG